MPARTIYCHLQDFDNSNAASEKSTLRVIILTGITMCVEIIAGLSTGSMALLADGWHMGTHAFALGITYLAYVMARRYSGSSVFSFGTGKFGILSGYTSALFLGATALYTIYESVYRFFNPEQIAFNEAIFVAITGLCVNAVSIWMLHGKEGHAHHGHSHHHHDHQEHEHHEHTHEHTHEHPHEHTSKPAHKHDHNLRAAYLHVMADALTSILAIAALLAGKYVGWAFLDPVMGVVGGILIAKWAWGLFWSSGLILLDGNKDHSLQQEVISSVEEDGQSTVEDLHIWPINSDSYALALSVSCDSPTSARQYSQRLSGIRKIKHSTIETHTTR